MTLPPRRIGIVGNREKKGARALLPALVRWLRGRDIRVLLERDIATAARGAGPGVPLRSLVSRVDALLVLGGDGTFLAAAREASRTDLPILGVNLGGLGFLTETAESDLYVALERLDPALVEASKDLGASRWATFRQVTWPLTLPGVAAGVLLVFVPLTGEWVIPSILGGGKSYYLGTFMANQVTDSRNWPLGSAAAVVLIGVMLVVVAGYLRILSRAAPGREVSLL